MWPTKEVGLPVTRLLPVGCCRPRSLHREPSAAVHVAGATNAGCWARSSLPGPGGDHVGTASRSVLGGRRACGSRLCAPRQSARPRGGPSWWIHRQTPSHSSGDAAARDQFHHRQFLSTRSTSGGTVRGRGAGCSGSGYAQFSEVLAGMPGRGLPGVDLVTHFCADHIARYCHSVPLFLGGDTGLRRPGLLQQVSGRHSFVPTSIEPRTPPPVDVNRIGAMPRGLGSVYLPSSGLRVGRTWTRRHLVHRLVSRAGNSLQI